MRRPKRVAIDFDPFDDNEDDQQRVPPRPTHRHTDFSISNMSQISQRSCYVTYAAPGLDPNLSSPNHLPPSPQINRAEEHFVPLLDVDQDNSPSDYVDPTLKARFRKRTFAGVCTFSVPTAIL